MVQEFLGNRRPLSAARELARIFEKIAAVRKRVLTLAIYRTLLGASWFWFVSLLVLGALCAFTPAPGLVRLLLRLTHFGLIGLGAWFGLRSATAGRRSIRSLRLRSWALHCEELHPEMRGSLVTCVDLAQEPGGQAAFEINPVAKALLRDTAARFRPFDPLVAAPLRRFALIQFGVALPIILFAILLFRYPDYTRATLAGLYRSAPGNSSGTGPLAGGVPGLTVTPGDIDVPRGSTVKVQADLERSGDAQPPEDISLKTLEHDQKADHTQVLPMLKDEKSRTKYHLSLLNVKNPTEYQVAVTASGDGKTPGRSGQSAIFKITPYDPPEIESLKGVVHGPAGLRIPDKPFDGGYIAGLASSNVTMTVTSNQALHSARLVEENGGALDGTIAKDGAAGASQTAEFQFVISEDKSYRLELLNTANRQNVDPPLVSVHVTPDLPPTISVKRPGADWSVHRIAEVSFEVEATDDFGLCDIAMEYRLNDGAITTVPLYAAAENGSLPLTQSAKFVLALEDLNVQVGDSIYYRFVAHDTPPESAKDGAPTKRAAYSQPYFLTIRPFDQIILNGGPGSAASGPQPPNERQVIVATTRVADRGDSITAEDRKAALEDISRTQRDVQVTTERFKEKIAMSPGIPNRAERVAHLESAIADMKKAEQLLDAGNPEAALAPENSALRHQIAALAGLPIAENWLNSAMPSPYPPDSPTSLSGQKADPKKDKYELADSAKGPKQDKELSDALERVRALGQRQKEFMETLKREEPPQGSGSSGANFVDSRANAEESRHQLERMREAMEKLDGLDDDTKNKLREGLDRAARELARVDESLAKKDAVQAQGNSARAMDALHELELNLQKAQGKNSRSRLRAVQAKLNEWIDRQRELQKGTAGLRNSPANEQQTARSGLTKGQSQLGGELQEDAQTLSGSAGSGSGGAQRTLEKVAQDLEQAAASSEKASNEIQQSHDEGAAKAQSGVLERLQQARDAVALAMERPGNDKNSKLEQALAAVQEMKRAVQPEPETSKHDQQEPGRGHGAPNTQAPQPTANEMRKQLEEIGAMVAQDPQIAQAIQQMLAQLAAQSQPGSQGQQGQQGQQTSQGQSQSQSSASNGGTTGLGGYRSGVTESYTRMLDELEELLANRLELDEQAQRLQQTPADALPARFRDMASKYFEALGANRSGAAPVNTGASDGKP